jgi:DNA-binding SARP family transcriptional activator
VARGTLPEAGNSIQQAARLQILGSFSLDIDGRQIETSQSVERLLALLAVLGGCARRSQLAGTLWRDNAEERALSNLRSTIWRMPHPCRALLVPRGVALALSDTLQSDFQQSGQLARRLLDGQAARDEVDRTLLMTDMLPGCDEDWLVIPRERHRQLRLHALEALASLDLAHGRALHAVDTALAAVEAEALRESAQLLLIRAHIEAGNRAAAVEQFMRFRALLAAELHVEPSPELTSIVAGVAGNKVTTL